MARKKRTKAKTPRRTSSRIRSRTAKGLYYDEHLGELTESPVTDKVKDVKSTSLEVETSVVSGLQGANECSKDYDSTGENSDVSNTEVSQKGVLSEVSETTPVVINEETPIVLDNVRSLEE